MISYFSLPSVKQERQLLKLLGVKCSWELETNDSKIILSFPSLMVYQIKVESEALVISTVDFRVQSWSHILGKTY